jgi:glutathione synthase/RimK-type ligase-like ATP-grasp enzyme
VIQLVVVENTKRWPLHIPGVEVVPARTYLTDARFAERRSAAVFNLCRTYGYQTLGYYVSLLAAARGHRPLPSVATLQDLRLPHMARFASEELDELIERSLAKLRGKSFELSIYFGRNPARKYDRLSQALFNQFPAPLLRARFARDPDEGWRLDRIRPIATSEIPDAQRDVGRRRAPEIARPRRWRARQRPVHDLAILVNPDEAEPPSDEAALRKFARAARKLEMEATVIHPDEIGQIAEFDALFIRETTSVDHHTFRFARRAAAEGLVVLDDPESILRCTNKVYQAEVFARHGISSPRTLVVDADDAERLAKEVGLPCVLKRPDSSFSLGVVKAATPLELRTKLADVLSKSQLAVAQEFTPSEFDWRIGVIDHKPLYACRYFMARGHWQVVEGGAGERRRWGRTDTVALADVPKEVLDLAVRAASLIGDGLYGVDLKESAGRLLVMEVNDNPSIESGIEDAVIKDELYLAVMSYFRERLDRQRRNGNGR